MAIEFKRNLSTFITDFFAQKAVLDARAYNTEIAVVFELGLGTTLLYATAQITVDSISKSGTHEDIPALNFSARIEKSGAPDFTHAQGRSVDAGEVNLINLDYVLSAAITDVDRIYDNTIVTVYLCFPKAVNYEGLVIFKGLLSEISGDDELARARIISELSSRVATVGKEITQRCVNELGDSWCGVPPSTLPCGAECSKIYEDRLAGCAHWGGVFNGVPFINPNNLVAGYSGAQGTGFEPINTGCPDIMSYFRAPNNTAIRGVDLKAGDTLLDHFDRAVIVEQADIIDVDYRYRVSTSKGASVVVSASHLFLNGLLDKEGKPAHAYKPEDFLVLVLPTGIAAFNNTGAINYEFKPYHAGKCVRLATTAPHTYAAGEQKGYYLGSHNKPMFPDIFPSI